MLTREHREDGRNRPFGRDDRGDESDLPGSHRRVGAQEAEDVPRAGEEEPRRRLRVQLVRHALERGPGRDDEEPGEQHPRQDRRRADHPRRP